MAAQLAVFVSEDRSVRSDQTILERKLVDHLAAWQDVRVTVVPHLYDLDPQGPAMRAIRQAQGDLVVLSWLHPRAAFWLLAANGVNGRLEQTSSLADEDRDLARSEGSSTAADRKIWCFDLRTHRRAETYLDEIARITGRQPAAESAEPASGAGGGSAQIEEMVRPRWYPVVDRDRCRRCMECVNFCLFEVFLLTATDEIVVDQPDACRPGCPSCARICPEGAILFPHADDLGLADAPVAPKRRRIEVPGCDCDDPKG